MDKVVYDADAVSGWLVDDNVEKPAGPLDPYYFGSVVHTAFSANLNSDEKYSPIHGLLRYLLLRRDPITSEIVPYKIYKHDPLVPESYTRLIEGCRNAVENKLNGKPYNVYNVLFWVQNIREHSRAAWLNREELTLMPLYLLVMCGELKTNVLQTKRECIKSYRRNLEVKITSMTSEYTNDPVHLVNSLSAHLSYLMELGYTTREVVRELTYLGMYHALISASRMGLINGVREELKTETSWLLTEAMSS